MASGARIRFIERAAPAAEEATMERRSREISRAMEWVIPLGVCCAEAQADGVPCWELGAECLECDRADPVRQLMLRLASAPVALPRTLH